MTSYLNHNEFPNAGNDEDGANHLGFKLGVHP